MNRKNWPHCLFGFTLMALILMGCATQALSPTVTPSSTPEPTIKPTETPVAPTATPEPTPTSTLGPTGPSPSARSVAMMAYDSESERVVLFGGLGQQPLSDTWAYDFSTNTWAKMSPTSGPDALASSAMTYDAESDRVILFGGATLGSDGEFQHMDTTWAYDFNSNTWEQMNPSDSPSPRLVRAMVYDSNSDRIILFGGRASEIEQYADTWTYDFNSDTWTAMAPGEAPPAEGGASMAYDAESNVVILFGKSGEFSNKLFVYNLETDSWTAIETTGGPARRDLQAMAYDAESDRVILVGGTAGGDEVWAYDYNSNTWTELESDANLSERRYHVMAYNAAIDRIILFGGQKHGADSNETWAYDYNSDTWIKMAPHP